MSDFPSLSRRARCSTCMRAQRTCICDLAVTIAHVTEVLILQHPLEVREAKGTARLLHLCLPRSRIVVGEQFDTGMLQSLLHDPWSHEPDAKSCEPPAQPVLLYPQQGQPAQEAGSETKRYRLVILDGTWRKSRKLLHLNPLLAALPRLSLSDTEPSRYRIRKAHSPQQLSTLEAACHALARLEGNAARFAPLCDVFSKFVARQMDYAVAARAENQDDWEGHDQIS